VLSVDLERNRIALTMKSATSADGRPARDQRGGKADGARPGASKAKPAPSQPKPFTPKPGTVAPNGMRFR
jgi:hypothetical protein